jgi:hypothetical protein
LICKNKIIKASTFTNDKSKGEKCFERLRVEILRTDHVKIASLPVYFIRIVVPES